LDCILITNDDGISEGLESLITYLHRDKIPLLVVIPDSNKSACSMAITLREKMRLIRQISLEDKLNEGFADLLIFTLKGTPADCALFVDFSKGSDLLNNLNPIFGVSGINYGANLSHDVLHSGTVGGARQMAMNGLPSMASSYCDYTGKDMDDAVKLTANFCKKLWNKKTYLTPIEKAFSKAELFLNLNIPKNWNGKVKYGSLGIRDYDNALRIENIEPDAAYDVSFAGPNIIEQDIEGSDVTHINSGNASVSLMPSWPFLHARYPNKEVLFALEELSKSEVIDWFN